MVSSNNARGNRAPRRTTGASSGPGSSSHSPRSSEAGSKRPAASLGQGPARSAPSRSSRPFVVRTAGGDSGRRPPTSSPQGARPPQAGGRRQFQGGNRNGGFPRRNGSALPQLTEVPVTPNTGEPVLRFVALGGLDAVGRNCSYYEYGDEIVMVDVGIQFPGENTPGIDYIIPNMASIEPKKKNVRGLIITHGHYDHFAAIHYLIEKMGNPIIYASQFTKAMIEKRHEEFRTAPKLRFQVVTDGSVVQISEHFKAEFFSVEHAIPESLGFILETPAGNMVSFGDYRIEIDEEGTPHKLEIFEKLAQRGVHSLFMDSTRAEVAGHNPSEKIVEANLDRLIKEAEGRVIIGTFSSLVDRLIQIIGIAKKHGRKVAITGRSMITNLDIAKNLGYMKGLTDVLIRPEDINKHRDSQVLVISTGTQGEPNSGFMRMGSGEHRLLQLKSTDTIIFSSSVIPGNEWGVQELHDAISRQVGALYHFRLLDIHSGGHAHAGDHELVLEIIKPKFIVPIHGYYFMRKTFEQIAVRAGLKKEQVILTDNGRIGEIYPDRFTLTNEKVPTSYVIVDGGTIGDVEDAVLRDRLTLSQEGMLVVILTVDRQTKRLIKTPDIMSRGFIHVRDNREIMDEITRRLRATMSRVPEGTKPDIDYFKSLVREQVGQYIFQKTKRRPMLLPVVIEV